MKPRGYCPNTGQPCKGSCGTKAAKDDRVKAIPVALQLSRWQSASDLKELQTLMASSAGKRVKLVSGNTGVGELNMLHKYFGDV